MSLTELEDQPDDVDSLSSASLNLKEESRHCMVAVPFSQAVPVGELFLHLVLLHKLGGGKRDRGESFIFIGKNHPCLWSFYFHHVF